MSQSKIELPPCLDLAAAEELKSGLVAAVERNEPLLLDCSAIERVGTSCIQLLVAAGRTLGESGCSMTLEQPPRVLLTALAELGLPAEPERWR